MTRILSILCVAVAATALGWSLATLSQGGGKGAPTALDSPQSPVRAKTDRDLNARLSAIESTLRELARDGRRDGYGYGQERREEAQDPEAGEAEAPPDPAEDDPEILEERERQVEDIENRMADGSWSNEDVLALRQHLATLPQAESLELMSMLTLAINNNELRVEDGEFPF